MAYTSEYPYCKFPFDEWNPVQERCLPHFAEESNLVVAASTASGKTAIAEAVFGHSLFNGGRCIYLSPLRAINNEKLRRWRHHPTLGEANPVLVDGKSRPSDPDSIRSSMLVISTIESFWLALRSKEEWTSCLSVVVLDEAHILGDMERGAVAEATLMMLRDGSPRCRIVLLSGTMGNPRELAIWLNRLNGLPSHYVSSRWRPGNLSIRVIAESGLDRQFSRAIEALKDNPSGKTLVFVHSMKVGKLLVSRLEKAGLTCAFYHAGLANLQKFRMLASFKSELGGLDVLVATSSLGAGIDL